MKLERQEFNIVMVVSALKVEKLILSLEGLRLQLKSPPQIMIELRSFFSFDQ